MASEGVRHDDNLLAAELALRLLDAPEEQAAMRRRAADTEFDAAVIDWESRLADLFDTVVEQVPDAGLWASIAARVAPGGGTPVEVPQAANDDGQVVDGRLRRGLRLWRAVAIAASAVAAALLLALLLRPDAALPPAVQAPPVSSDAIVAQLNDAEGGTILTARLDLRDDRLRVRPTDIPAGEGEPELWVIPADRTPRSLGIVRREGTSSLLLPADIRQHLVDGSTLALTLEDPAGAPHAAPTGTILATARITRL